MLRFKKMQTAVIPVMIMILLFANAQYAITQNTLSTVEIVTQDSSRHRGNLFFVTDSLLMVRQNNKPFDEASFFQDVEAVAVSDINKIVIRPNKKQRFVNGLTGGTLTAAGIGASLALLGLSFFELIRSTPGQYEGPLSRINISIGFGLGVGFPVGCGIGFLGYILARDKTVIIGGSRVKYSHVLPILKENAIITDMTLTVPETIGDSETRSEKLERKDMPDNFKLNPVVIYERKGYTAAILHFYMGQGKFYSPTFKDVREAFENSDLGPLHGSGMTTHYNLGCGIDLYCFLRVGFDLNELNYELKTQISSYTRIIGSSADFSVSYLYAVHVPVLKNRFEFSFGAGYGITRCSYNRSLYYQVDDLYEEEKNHASGPILRLGLDVYLLRTVSFNLTVIARKVTPFQIPELTQYVQPISDRIPAGLRTLQAHSVDLSGVTLSTSIGIHF